MNSMDELFLGFGYEGNQLHINKKFNEKINQFNAQLISTSLLQIIFF